MDFNKVRRNWIKNDFTIKFEDKRYKNEAIDNCVTNKTNYCKTKGTNINIYNLI